MLNAISLALVQESTRFGGTEGPNYTRYLVVCGLLVLLLAVFVTGARRFVGGTLKRRAATRSLRIVDVLPLGSKQRLCVVQCYDRTFVLGQGEKELRLVAELDAATLPGAAPAEALAAAAPYVEAPLAAPASGGRGLAAPFESLLAGAQKRIQREAERLRTQRATRTAEPSARVEEIA